MQSRGGLIPPIAVIATTRGELLTFFPWVCWASGGGWQGVACSHPRCFREALSPLCCLLQWEQSCPCLQAASPRVSISSPTLCLHKPPEQSWRLFLPPGRNAASFNGLSCKVRRVLAGPRVGGIPRLTVCASALVFQRSHLSPHPRFASACPCLLTVFPCFKLLMLQGTRKYGGNVLYSCTKVVVLVTVQSQCEMGRARSSGSGEPAPQVSHLARGAPTSQADGPGLPTFTFSSFVSTTKRLVLVASKPLHVCSRRGRLPP